jgi:TonB family protein
MTALILGAVGMILFLVVAITAIVILRRPDGATASPSPGIVDATPTPPPAPTKGALRVESTPAGAAIFVDNALKGRTPDEVELPLGSHEVRLELDGYSAAADTVMLTADIPRTALKVTMTVEPPKMGTADVVSNPPGATVKIDGTSVGVTPLSGHKLKAGNHRVEVVSDGYEPWAGQVSVRENKSARVDANLRKIAVATPPPPTLRTPPPTTMAAAPAATPVPTFPEALTDVKPQKIASACKEPEYPADLPRLKPGQRASVTVSFTVLETGETSALEVIESAGDEVDQAVVSAYKQCRFTPGQKAGAKVRVKMAPRRKTFLGGGG